MKRTLAYALAAVLLAACSTQEKDFQTPTQEEPMFYASFEQPTEEGTKVYATEDLYLRWNADDRITIFNKYTYNQEYRFNGETGDNSGSFKKVDNGDFVTGNYLDNIYAVYPYQESTRISETGVISVTLPAEQQYAENTFGLGANTMVSATVDNQLLFKNVGGYLVLKLYGDGVTVSSITLRGNNGEKLAGKVSVTMPLDGVPTAVMADNASTEITLTCPTPVQLGATAEESTQFWFVVPPVVFSEGFTITVNNSLGGTFEKSTSKSVAIERNKLSKMAPMEMHLSLPRNVIYYKSLGGVIVTPTNPDAFGANILSNEFVDGMGIITFDGDVTKVGEEAFRDCFDLKGIILPDGVTSIGDFAFCGSSGLEWITIPDGVTDIGNSAFRSCRWLSSITIPKSVTSIGEFAFSYCDRNLTSFIIPDSVTSIGEQAFSFCTRLISITIPDSVTSIGRSAFQNCSSLSSITIPGSVTSFGPFAFSYCSSLSSITILEGVTSVGLSAFSHCTSLTRITFPESVTSIEYSAFSGCSALTSVTLPERMKSIGSAAFRDCFSLSGVILSDSLTSIGDSAFSGCLALTSITIPESVMSIGEGPFVKCFSLQSFTGKFASSDGLYLIDSGKLIAVALGAINDEVAIPDNVTGIGDGVFSFYTDLTSVTIPQSVTYLEDYVFSSCTSLTSITIPPSVTYLGYYAFSNCTSLTSITVLSSTPPFGRRGSFDETNNAPIYVPLESVEAYKTAAECWIDYADRIQAIPEMVLATNPYVQKYLEEVTYKGIVNEETKILGYPGGGPGEADIPPTHTINWTADASAGNLKFHVWEGNWSRDYDLAAGTTSQDMTNLVPGRLYRWSVTSSMSGDVIAEGSFKTKGLLHQVYFEPKGRNARDLGGWKGLGGKTLAFRKLYRGGAIHGSRVNSAGKAEFRAQGIKAEVDLREASSVPSMSPMGDDIAFFAPGFDSGYNHMVRDNQPKVKETFCFVVQCLRENKPVYFHCGAGRDRTGTLAVLLEGALGVSESDMAKDYELTYFSPEDWSMYNGEYGHIISAYSFQSIYKTIFSETDSGTYQERIEKYLLKIGVPQVDIDDFRALMLE